MLFRKLEPKSPISANKDEDSSKEEEYVFEKFNLQGKNLRPVSAKGLEFFKKKRPVTSKNPSAHIKREKYRKLVDYSVLSKLKPRRVTIDRERLYEENMALKLKNNGLHEELTRLRTKTLQIEKELNKREDQADHLQVLKPTHMINSLKSSIKDLKYEIQLKNEEISKLKKNIKSTKINEIELEVQAYIDECTRLRHHLEEIMRQRDTPQLSQGISDDKNIQQSFALNNLKKENKDLNQAVAQGNEEINKWRERVMELEKNKKKNGVKKGEINSLKNEVSKLKSMLDNAGKEISMKESGQKEELGKLKKNLAESQNKIGACEGKIKDLTYSNEELNRQIKNLQDSSKSPGRKSISKKSYPPKLLQIINYVITSKRISLQTLIEGLDKKHSMVITENEFFSSLLPYYNKLKRKYITEILGVLRISKSKDVSFKRLEEFYNDFSYESRYQDSSSSEDEPIMKNLQENIELKLETSVSAVDKSDLSQNKPKKEEKVKKINKTNKEDDQVIEEEKRAKDEQQAKEEKLRLEEKLKQEETLRQEEKMRQEEKIKQEEKLRQEEALRQEELHRQEEIQKNEAEKKLKQEESEKIKRKELEEEKTSKDHEKTRSESNKRGEEKTQKDPEPKPKKESKGKKKGKKSKNEPKEPSKKLTLSIEPELQSILDHLSCRMQINRIPKSKLFNTLFGSLSIEKPLSKTEMSSFLKKPPFSFNTQDIDALNTFLLDSPKSTAKNIEEKLSKVTDNWEIFSNEDEESFDQQLVQIISKNHIELKEACKKFDKTNTNVVSLEIFKSVLSDHSIVIPPRVFKYMLLLFYSHDMKLGQVPYHHFLKAYSDPSGEEEEGEEGEEDVSDEEKAKVVRHYLGIMAQILIQNNRGVLEVFECDESGIISPEEFVEGLRRMGLGEIEQEHVMLMLEALQYEESSEICVHIEELEEILMHYGVPAVDGKEQDKTSEHSGGHYKKVSLLDSENYDLSDDSEKHHKASSKGLSENSPFTKNKSLDQQHHSDDEYQSDYEDD